MSAMTFAKSFFQATTSESNHLGEAAHKEAHKRARSTEAAEKHELVRLLQIENSLRQRLRPQARREQLHVDESLADHCGQEAYFDPRARYAIVDCALVLSAPFKSCPFNPTALMMKFLSESLAPMHLVWFGLVWFGLAWFGVVLPTQCTWFGLVWFGLVWFGLVWFGLVWFGLVWFDLAWLEV